MKNILMVYDQRAYPMRVSQKDHLLSFEKYTQNSRFFYFNCSLRSDLSLLKFINFDLIIYHWSFAGIRCDGNKGRKLHIKNSYKIKHLKDSKAIKIILPQDEFLNMDLLCNFINEFKIDFVFSVSPETEWPKIYRNVDSKKIKFVRVLTGYLNEDIVRRWGNYKNIAERKIDIGYRVVSNIRWGKFNIIKQTLAEEFIKFSENNKLKSDIKVGHKFFKIGEEWLKFLSNCKFTIGVEGGSDLLDWEGKISKKIDKFIKQKPNYKLNDLEKECFPSDLNSKINIVAISPRHLEACMTNTVQILIEGSYNNILKPNIHYIPLKSDFSNLKEISKLLSNNEYTSRIRKAAYKDIVLSGKYTYKNFINTIMGHVQIKDHVEDIKSYFLYTTILLYNKFFDCIGIFIAANFSFLRFLRDYFFVIKKI